MTGQSLAILQLNSQSLARGAGCVARAPRPGRHSRHGEGAVRLRGASAAPACARSAGSAAVVRPSSARSDGSKCASPAGQGVRAKPAQRWTVL